MHISVAEVMLLTHTFSFRTATSGVRIPGAGRVSMYVYLFISPKLGTHHLKSLFYPE